MTSTQAFAGISPAILANATVQTVLTEYSTKGTNLESLKASSPSAGIVKLEIKYSFDGAETIYTVCRSLTTDSHSQLISVGNEMECE